ncbi:hypothetical protein Tco_1500150 [Tanacetum coccineum]
MRLSLRSPYYATKGIDGFLNQFCNKELLDSRIQKLSSSGDYKFKEETSLGDQEDSSKQGKKINDLDADAKITLVDESQGRHDDDLISIVKPVTIVSEVVTTANVEVSTASLTAATITNVELTLAQTLAELKSATVC